MYASLTSSHVLPHFYQFLSVYYYIPPVDYVFIIHDPRDAVCGVGSLELNILAVPIV